MISAVPKLRERHGETTVRLLRPRPLVASFAVHAATIGCALLVAAASTEASAEFVSVAIVPSRPAEWSPDRSLATPPPHETATPVSAEPCAIEPRLAEPTIVEPPLEPLEETLFVDAPGPAPATAPSSEPTAAVWRARVARPANEVDAAPPERAVEPEQPPREPATDAPSRPAPMLDGGLVQASPLARQNRPPEYPRLAARRGLEGTVTVLLEIGVDGLVTRAFVATSSGHAVLDDAALEALAKWRFEPARRFGVAVPGTYRREVVFRLTQ